MLNTAELIEGGKIRAEVVDSAADGQAIAEALRGSAIVPEVPDALAIAAGKSKAQQASDELLKLLASDSIAGHAAGWALAQLGKEKELIAAVANGSLDVRENGYYGLAVLAAHGKASPALAQAMTERVDAEVERARAKQMCLGEKPCRVLAILGAKNTAESIQKVMESDPFTDRFELQRLRKAVDNGKDQESIQELSAPWTVQFADHVFVAPAPAKAPAPTAATKPQVAKPVAPPASKPMPPPPAEEDVGEAEGEEIPAGAAPQPIDWKAFAESDEAKKLPAQSQALIGQLGPLLEQLAARFVNAALADLAGQEFAAILLQILPQALPQQHVQVALSPQALNGYQALANYLARTGIAPHGADLITAVKMVREQLKAQIRQAGILNGPDYSDPDEAPVKQ